MIHLPLERTRNPEKRSPFDPARRVAPRPNPELDPRTIARWEDDGGYIPSLTDDRKRNHQHRTPARHPTSLEADS